jgi:hypothetical protein
MERDFAFFFFKQTSVVQLTLHIVHLPNENEGTGDDIVVVGSGTLVAAINEESATTTTHGNATDLVAYQ